MKLKDNEAAVNNDESLKILESMIGYSSYILPGLKTVKENGRILQHQ